MRLGFIYFFTIFDRLNLLHNFNYCRRFHDREEYDNRRLTKNIESYNLTLKKVLLIFETSK